MIRRVLFPALLALILHAGVAAAQASPYVRLDDDAYRDLDLLVAAGLVPDLVTRERPYTRGAFVRAVAQAQAALQGAGPAGGVVPSHPARLLEAAARLHARFGEGAGNDHRGVGLLSSWAENPSRHVPRALRDELSTSTLLDAVVAPLLQRNMGVDRFDGATATAFAWHDVALGRRFAASVAPRVWARAGGGEDGDAGLALDHGYVRGLFGNLSVTVGRNAVVHGHARELSPILSTNARGLDMVRLSMERPARLPWIFRHLGPTSAAGTLATMGSNRVEEGSVLVVWEGAVRPHANLEFGVTLMNQQGGKGTPEATLWERIMEALFIHRRLAPGTTVLPLDPLIGDKFVGLDARLTLPGPRIHLFAEVNTTDDHDLFVSRPKQTFWHEAAWAVGFRRFALGVDGRWDLWAEAGRVGVRPYGHHQMTSGLTLDRRILGSPLGPLAAGVTGGVDWTGARDRVSASGAWERYSSDAYEVRVDPNWRWVRTTDNPDEIRLRTTVDWTRHPAAGAPGVRTHLRLGYEHVTRFDFTDRNRANFLAQVGVAYVW